MQGRYISDWVLVLEDEIRIGKFLGERLQGKVEVKTDVSKKSNKSEYGNFLNTSGITFFFLLGNGVKTPLFPQ